MTQAIVLAVSRVALFAGDVFMDGTGLVVGDGWSYRPNADEQLVAVEVAGLPAGPWVGGAWRVTDAGEWVVHDQALIDAAQPPLAHRQPVAEMNKRAFRDLAVSIFGFASWQAAQADPALAEVWDVYASGVTVSRTDVLAFLPAFVALGHATQAQADQLLAEWPHA